MAHTHGNTRRRALAGLAAAVVLGTAGGAWAGDFVDDLKLELGALGGVHIFANDLELGVADDPALPSPKTSGLFGVRARRRVFP
jgi:hypothetical protein